MGKKQSIVVSGSGFSTIFVILLEYIWSILVQRCVNLAIFVINFFLALTWRFWGRMEIVIVTNVFVISLISLVGTYLGKRFYAQRVSQMKKYKIREYLSQREIRSLKIQAISGYTAVVTIVVSTIITLAKHFLPGLFFWI